MILARVEGHVTSTVCHPSLAGQKIVLCTPIDEFDQPTGFPVAAIDPMGSGIYAKVFITTDGQFTQKQLHDDKSPIRNQIIGILDSIT